MDKYTLVNPIILGTFSKTFSGSSALEGAENFWAEFNSYIVNSIPKFHFTMQGGSGDLHHFKVTEKFTDKKTTKWNIEEEQLELTSSEKDQLIQKSKDVTNLTGGSRNKKNRKSARGKYQNRHHKKEKTDDDDSSSSSSLSSSSSDDSDSDDELITKLRINQLKYPISYWWYAPSVYKLKSYYGPVFSYPYKPYVEYWVPT